MFTRIYTFMLMTLTLGVLLTAGLLNAPKVSAQSADQSCGAGNSVHALGQLPGNSYSVYVKLAHPADSADVSVYYQPFSTVASTQTGCQLIAKGKANGKGYTALGALALTNTANLGTVTLVTTGLSDKQGASAPSAVFLPIGEPPCRLDAGCVVSFAGVEMEMLPDSITLSKGGLELGIVRPITTSKIQSVLYSIDDQPAYQTKKLESFDLKYVSNGEHAIQRKVLLESGQVLRDNATINRGSSGQIHYYLLAQYYRSRTVINVLFFIVILPLGLLLAIYVLNSRKRRHHWQLTHTASAMQFSPEQRAASLAALNAEAAAARREEGFIDILKRYKWWGISAGSVLLVIFVFSTFIVTIFTVDGPSMEPTLSGGSKKLLNKAPLSLSKLNRSVYVPSRGEIVVLKHKGNSLSDKIGSAKAQNYVVKRVIGLPGERVLVKDGVITVFNQGNALGFEPDKTEKWLKSTPASVGYYVDVTLEDGQIFVVGDNRTVSVDSRSYGAVNSTDIVGIVK